MGGVDWEIGAGWRTYMDWADSREYRIGWTGRNTRLGRLGGIQDSAD